MALRRGRRESLRSPTKVRLDRRGRETNVTLGSRRSSAGAMVEAPIIMRLVAPAPVQEALGEDVPAVEIGGELDFVDGDEGDVEIARHGLDGGDPVARVAAA